jgi:hypothetical protein
LYLDDEKPELLFGYWIRLGIFAYRSSLARKYQQEVSDLSTPDIRSATSKRFTSTSNIHSNSTVRMASSDPPNSIMSDDRYATPRRGGRGLPATPARDDYSSLFIQKKRHPIMQDLTPRSAEKRLSGM